MTSTPTAVLIVPGLGNSDGNHWQSKWEQANPTFQRVHQLHWDTVTFDAWASALEQAVAVTGPEVVLVAHSLGCLLVSQWAAASRLTVKGALLVAPPDPGRANFPAQVSGFAAPQRRPLGFPSTVVASADDPYAELEYVRTCAAGWGSHFVDIGVAGHINSDSGLGAWPQGRALLASLMERG